MDSQRPNHFERLGLPGRFSVDPAALERGYLAASLAVHPDFHGGGTAGERAASETVSAEINEAYAVLSDPFRRAEYLLALAGGPTAGAIKDLAPGFLMEMMELRERTEGADAAERGRIETELKTRSAALLAGVGTLLDAAGGDPAKLTAVRKELNAAKYLRGLLRDLRGL